MSAVPSLLADEASFTERLTKRLAEIKAAGKANVDLSLAERLALCERAEPGFLEAFLERLEPSDWSRLYYDWGFWARRKQLAPVSRWRKLFWLAGRGTGKTRAAAEWLVGLILSGLIRHAVIVGPTLAKIKEVQIGGIKLRSRGANGSGILDVLPPWVEVDHTKNTGELYFPQFNCKVTCLSAETPDYVGSAPNAVWMDELCVYRHPELILSQLSFSNRERSALPPQTVITSTPRPKKFLKELLLEAGVEVIHATTRENRGNVSDEWLAEMEAKPERERLQELEAEVLGDNPDALFTPSAIDILRVHAVPDLDRIVVGVDPSGSDLPNADPTGLVVVGRKGPPLSRDAHCYVLEARSIKAAPEEWGKQAFELAEKFGASALCIEKNYGAQYIASTLRAAGERRGYALKKAGDRDVMVHPETGLRFEIIEVHARGDKAQRAYPVAALATPEDALGKGGRIHVIGHQTPFEDELTQWSPVTSPNSPGMLDAFVHAVVELLQLDRKDRKVDHRAAMAGLTEANAQLSRSQPGSASRWVGTGGRGGRVAY